MPARLGRRLRRRLGEKVGCVAEVWHSVTSWCSAWS